MLCRPFGDLSRAWLCYVGPLVTLAVRLAMLCRPFGDLSRAWPFGVGYDGCVRPLVTLAVLGYIWLCRPFGDLIRV